ncbi:MAG: hypothetical protein HPY54_16570 [Chthonomonadetes bacterium]|nr:hypothetical protein [Chthonomonadetes bacterium]
MSRSAATGAVRVCRAHTQLFLSTLTHAGFIGAFGSSSTTNTSEGEPRVL